MKFKQTELEALNIASQKSTSYSATGAKKSIPTVSSRDLTDEQLISLMQIDEKLLGITGLSEPEVANELIAKYEELLKEETKELEEALSESKIDVIPNATEIDKKAILAVKELGLEFTNGKRRAFGLIELARKNIVNKSTKVKIYDTACELDSDLTNAYDSDDIIISAIEFMPLNYGSASRSVYKESETTSIDSIHNILLHTIFSKTTIKGKSLDELLALPEVKILNQIIKKSKLSKDMFLDTFKDVITELGIKDLVEKIYETK